MANKKINENKKTRAASVVQSVHGRWSTTAATTRGSLHTITGHVWFVFVQSSIFCDFSAALFMAQGKPSRYPLFKTTYRQDVETMAINSVGCSFNFGLFRIFWARRTVDRKQKKNAFFFSGKLLLIIPTIFTYLQGFCCQTLTTNNG